MMALARKFGQEEVVDCLRVLLAMQVSLHTLISLHSVTIYVETDVRTLINREMDSDLHLICAHVIGQ